MKRTLQSLAVLVASLAILGSGLVGAEAKPRLSKSNFQAEVTTQRSFANLGVGSVSPRVTFVNNCLRAILPTLGENPYKGPYSTGSTYTEATRAGVLHWQRYYVPSLPDTGVVNESTWVTMAGVSGTNEWGACGQY